ncbi:MAG TPA: hypothetical protein VJV79_34135 [Polyangiaceae bacterium]|nr:hypothetical protein [Polyangiaceae bacterium]
MNGILLQASAVVLALPLLGLIVLRKTLTPEWVLRSMLAVAVWVRLCLAVFVPTFQAPDEEAHFNVIRYIALHHALPLQPAQLDFRIHDYEAYQPPLYYLLSSVPYTLGRALLGDDAPKLVVLLRVVGIGWWWATARVTLRLLQRAGVTDAALRFGVMAVICFVPTQVYTSAALTNDNAVVFFAVLSLYLAFGARGWHGAIVMGFALAALLLSKLNGAGAFVGAITLYALQLLESEPKRMRAAARLALAGAIVIALLAPWLHRNLTEYGSLLALDRGNPAAHWPIVSGSIKVARSLAGGFWAVSGVESEIRQLPGISFVLTCVVGVGCAGAALKRDETVRGLFRSRARKLTLACAVSLSLTLASAFSFGLRSGMPHGRLLFGALLPIALLYAVGMRHLGARVGSALRTTIAPLAGYTAAFTVVTLGTMGALLPGAVAALGMAALWLITGRLAPDVRTRR